MQRTAIVVTVAVATLLMGVPGQVAAHPSSATDLNNVYDKFWQVLGPGGVTEEAGVNDLLDESQLGAKEAGGNDVTQSCTHDFDGDAKEPALQNDCKSSYNGDEAGTDVHTMKSFYCEGAKSFGEPLTDADLRFDSPMPYKHNDLENGIFEATGSFLVPIEVTGKDAGKINQLYFGFLHTSAWPLSSAACQPPFPAPGAYYEFYRAGNPTEPCIDQSGVETCKFEVPVNTLLVPDAPYGAVLRALDSSGNTLGVSFVYSNVNNYRNDANFQPGTPTACDQSGSGETLCPYHDTTPPHASVFQNSFLPREDTTANLDGTSDNPADDQVAGDCTDGVAIEYGEPLATDENGNVVGFEVVNHNPTVNQFNPPDRDVDSVPIETTARDNWGPGFCIPNPPVSGGEGTFKVRAWDQSGNVGVQTIQVT